MVKDLQFQESCSVCLAKMNGGIEVDGDLPKVFGPGGLESCVDPPDIQVAQSELHVFEHHGLREVN